MPKPTPPGTAERGLAITSPCDSGPTGFRRGRAAPTPTPLAPRRDRFGHYTLTVGTGGEATVDEGSYVVVWKRDGGALKLHWDIFHSDLSG